MVYDDDADATATSCRCAKNAGLEVREHLLLRGTRDREENIVNLMVLDCEQSPVIFYSMQRSGPGPKKLLACVQC